MGAVNDTPHEKSVSELLGSIAGKGRGKIAMTDILAVFGDRAFGAVIFVFAAPLVLPMPPGVSALLGAPLLFVTAQWMVGRPTLWLPKMLLRQTMSRNDFRSMVEKLTPYLGKLERRLRPRATFIFNPAADRLTGAVCFLLSIIVFLPIPFGNMLPSFAIAAFAIGTVERDGLAIIIGWFGAFLSVAVLILLSQAIIAAVSAFFGALTGIFT